MMVDVGLRAERRRYARQTKSVLDVGIEAEKRRYARRKPSPPRDVVPELRKQELQKRTIQRKEAMVERYLEIYPETRGVYDVGEGYVAIITARGTQILPQGVYETRTPEQLLELGAISQEEYARYQKQKERAFRQWERTVYPKWAEAYELYELEKAAYERQVELHELGIGLYEMLAVVDPWKAMRFGVEMGFFTQAEFDAWARKVTATQETTFHRWDIQTFQFMETYEKLWQEDPNKALEYAYKKGVITAEEYQERYLHPTFTEFVSAKAEEFLKYLEEKPTAAMFQYSEGLVKGVLGFGIGVISGIDALVLGVGRLTGQKWAYQVKPTPLLQQPSTVIFSPIFGPEGLRWPTIDKYTQQQFEQYMKKLERYPTAITGDIFMLWAGSKAVGWALGKAWGGVKWAGGRVISEATKKAWHYRVASPTRVWYETTIKHPLDVAIHRSWPYRHLYLGPKTTLQEWGYRLGALRWHLPSHVQKLFWPREYAIRGIEAAFPWKTSKLYWHTFALQEQKYMVPFFTQQTLWMAMPTKEWAKIRFLESMYKRTFYDWTLGWTKGLYPAFGISPTEAGKMLSGGFQK